MPDSTLLVARRLLLALALATPFAAVQAQNAPAAAPAAADPSLQNQEQQSDARRNQKIEHLHTEDSGASVESKTTDPLQGHAHVRSLPTLAALGTFVVLVVALASYLTARVATARRVDGGYDGVKLLCFEMSFDWDFQGNGAVERWEDDRAIDDETEVGDTGIWNLYVQITRRQLRKGATKHDAVVTTLWGTHLCTVPALEPYDLWFIDDDDDDDDDERRLDTEEDPNEAEVVRLLLGMSYSYEYS